MGRIALAALLFAFCGGGMKPLLAADDSTSWLDFGLDYRLRYESLDNRYRPGEEGGDQQLDHRTHLRLGIRHVLDPFRFVVEFEDSRAQLTDSGSYVNSTHVRELSVLQLHGKLVTESLFGHSLHSELQFGRLTMDLGRRRLVARNVFRNTINRFDGLRWVVTKTDKWNLQAFVVRPVIYGAPNLNHGRRMGYFWGAYYQNQTRSWLKYDLFFLHLYDDQKIFQQRNSHIKTLGARIYRTPAEGGWMYEYESALQFGQFGPLKQRAHLQNVEAGYRWTLPWKPTLLFQYTYASGDQNPGDDTSGTFLPLFGARRFDLAPTGIYALFTRANINSPGYRISVKPARPLELVFNHRLFRLAQSRDTWAGMSRKDVTGKSGTDLGNHLEGYARWKVTNHLNFEAGYAHFFPGGFVERQVPRNGQHGANYFYLMNELHL